MGNTFKIVCLVQTPDMVALPLELAEHIDACQPGLPSMSLQELISERSPHMQSSVLSGVTVGKVLNIHGNIRGYIHCLW
jgi:hypothetical protein